MDFIEGVVQSLMYNNASQYLVCKLTHDGLDTLPYGDVKASLDFGAEGLTNLDTVIQFWQKGGHGNEWKIYTAPAATASITVGNDTKIILISFVNGVTTVANIETLIGLLSGTDARIEIKTTGTGANILTTAGDTMVLTNMAGGTFLAAAVPLITIHNPCGDVVVNAQAMTQAGDEDSSWYVYSIDTTVIATWIKGVNYRAVVDYQEVNIGFVAQENFLFDVVAQSFYDPLITTEEIDKEHPTWSAFLPETWDNWQGSIRKAHRDLMRHLRGMKDHEGELIYPHMIMDAGQLRNLAMAMTESHIAWAIDRLEGWREHYDERVTSELAGLSPLIIDRDDDQIIDADEEEGEVIQTTLFEK